MATLSALESEYFNSRFSLKLVESFFTYSLLSAYNTTTISIILSYLALSFL